MILKYTLTGRQLYDFQFRFAKDMGAKVLPKWIRPLVGYASIGIFGLLCVLFAATLGHAFFLWWLSLVLVTVMNLLSQNLTAKAYARYYQKLPGALDWEHRVSDGRLVTINRDVETSFPINPTAIIAKDEEFLYIEFNDRGRVRILRSAFSSPAQLEEFEGLFANAKRPNPESSVSAQREAGRCLNKPGEK